MTTADPSTAHPSPTAGPAVGRAEACANIALAKYWGKSGRGGNRSAVPSLSMTLDALRTRTEVVLREDLERDQVSLNGRPATEGETRRVVELLDRVRALAGRATRAQVFSENNFPTAAGLASSASGFSALAVAASRAANLRLSAGQLSDLARQSSASAARSLFAGFAQLLADADEAEPVAPPEQADLAMLVLVVAAGKKPMSSTLGMNHTRETSPFYPAWVEQSPHIFERAKKALLASDFADLAGAMELSTRLMHATMMSAEPPILYLRGATLELMHEISLRRSQGYPEAYTMDAGPNVKLLTQRAHAEQAREHYRNFPGLSDVILCRPGPAAAVLSLTGPLSSAARQEEVR